MVSHENPISIIVILCGEAQVTNNNANMIFCFVLFYFYFFLVNTGFHHHPSQADLEQ